MANRIGQAFVSGLVGAIVGGGLVFGIVWTGSVAVRDRAISELERTLQDQDTHRDDACVLDDDTEQVSQPCTEPLKSIRI